MTPGIIVGCILFACDELLGVKELPVCTSSYLICIWKIKSISEVFTRLEIQVSYIPTTVGS